MSKILKSSGRGSLIVLSGPSGCGKQSVCERLNEYNNNFWVSVSCTTRKPRLGDEDGITYYFISEEEFKKKIDNDEFLEYNYYNGNYYGTLKANIEKYLEEGVDVILEVDVNGALSIKHKIKEAIFIFLMPPTMKDLILRLKKRGSESNDKIISRIKTAYNEINEVSKYNYVIVNDEVDNAARKMNSIIEAQKCMVDRIEEVYLDNPEEEIHELLIDNKEFINKDTII